MGEFERFCALRRQSNHHVMPRSGSADFVQPAQQIPQHAVNGTSASFKTIAYLIIYSSAPTGSPSGRVEFRRVNLYGDIVPARARKMLHGSDACGAEKLRKSGALSRLLRRDYGIERARGDGLQGILADFLGAVVRRGLPLRLPLAVDAAAQQRSQK